MGKNTKKNGDLLGFNGFILGKNIKNMEENGGFSSEKAMFDDTRNPHLYCWTIYGVLLGWDDSAEMATTYPHSWLQFMSAKELINGWGWRIFPTQVPSLLWLRIDFV